MKPSPFKLDLPLLLVTMALVALGVVVIYSSSGPHAEIRHLPSSFFIVNHLKKLAVGLLVMGIGLMVDHHVWLKVARPLFLVSLVLLVVVLIPGVGINKKGASRWINIGFEFQPSEMMKYSLAFLMASKLADAGDQIKDLKVGFIRPLLLTGVVFGLIFLQPNFSMAAMLLIVVVTMMFAAGTPLKYFLFSAGLALPALVGLLFFESYRLRRFNAFFNPDSNTTVDYQQMQSLIGLGNGGLIGTGLGQGTQKFGFLPEPFTDTIFAILGEELGFVGTFAVLTLFAVLAWRGFRIAREAQSRFGSLLAVALTTSLCLNVMIHVMVCIRLMPATGQPLPLVSYGGTSLIMNMFAIGVLLNLSKPGAGKKVLETPSGATGLMPRVNL